MNLNIEYSIPETGDVELDRRIDELISESNDIYFKVNDLGISDAEMVLLKGTEIKDCK